MSLLILHLSCLQNQPYMNDTIKFTLYLRSQDTQFFRVKQLVSRCKQPFRLFPQIRGLAGLGVAMWASLLRFQRAMRLPVDGVISLIITDSVLKCDFPVTLSILVISSSPGCICFHFYLTCSFSLEIHIISNNHPQIQC